MDIIETNETPSTGAISAELAEAMEDAGFPALDDAPAAATKAKPAAGSKAERRAKAEAADVAERKVAESVDAALEAGEGAEAAGDKDKPAAEVDQDAADRAELAGVRQRSAARRKAREDARTAAAKPAEVAATPSKPAVESAPAAKPTADETSVAKAVQDVIAQIARMTAEDEAAATAAPGAAGTPKPAADAAARADQIKSLTATIEGLGAKIEDGSKLKDTVGKLESKLQEQIDRQTVMGAIDRTIDTHLALLPNLAGERNAAAMVYRAADKFYEKHGKVPSLRFVAEKVEAVLARRNAGDTAASAAESPTGKETRPSTRRTVSTTTATPPAARRDPDTRTAKEVERDLFRAVGQPVDDDDD